MLSVRKTGSESEVFVPLQHLEKGIMIATEMSLVKPWEPDSNVKDFYDWKPQQDLCQLNQNSFDDPPELVFGSCESISPSGFEFYKENDVLYPTIAKLPYINMDRPVIMCVVGVKDVGKSALAVRFLSGQQGFSFREATTVESKIHLRPTLSATQSVEVDIVDVPLALKDGEEPWVDKVFVKDQDFNGHKSSLVFVIMYSITDRNSFHVAAECLQAVRLQSVDVPILVLANKVDLSHLRQVCLSEGRDLCRQFDAAFHEVSVANCPDQAIELLNKLIKHLQHIKKTSLSSPVPITSNLEAEVLDQSGPNDFHESYDISTERNRKFSMFNTAGRMLNNLMLLGSRSSLPPDLRTSCSSSQNQNSSSPPSLPFSTARHDRHQIRENSLFKNVFKKKSV